MQKLLIHLGCTSKSIDECIKKLVKEGLPIRIQQALDICRVIGNNAVHPGEINVNESLEVAASLFGLINLIVEDRITNPKQLNALYNTLPGGARENIEKRDGKGG